MSQQRPAPRHSSLAGASVVGAGWNNPSPRPAETPQAPAETPDAATVDQAPAGRPERPKTKTKTSFYQAEEDADRMRGVIAATAFQEGVPAFPTAWLNALVNREMDRLEKKYGGPWEPIPAGKSTRGRPAGQ